MPEDHREYVEENRERWEELAAVHPDTDAYDVESFLAGESTLDPVEPDEVGPVEAGRFSTCSVTSASTRCRGPAAAPT